ncbi:glycosyltransferase family 2 protein [Pseudomonas proteolytica]|uniref:glycosyltransferase family 2 protein n=1 Tax=Pseudomonas proteolytica TaxID=219574 RepID=UPI0030D80FC5
MVSTKPLVSILVPVYNREGIISETLSSALSQTYENIEVIVVDNASTDGTWSVISDYANRDSRVKAFKNESNLGPVRNWLRCVECATGMFAKILWSDDLISPDFLEKTIPYFDDPQVGFVYTATKIFTEKPEAGMLSYANGKTGVYDAESFIQGDFKAKGYPLSPGCAVFYLKDVKSNLMLQVPNGIGSDFSMHAIGNDLLLFLLTANQYKKMAFISDVLSYFRSHSGSISIESTDGKLPLHYDIARAHFAETYRPDLLDILNVKLFFDLKKYSNSKKFGLENIADFYVENKFFKVNFLYAGMAVASRVLRKFS